MNKPDEVAVANLARLNHILDVAYRAGKRRDGDMLYQSAKAYAELYGWFVEQQITLQICQRTACLIFQESQNHEASIHFSSAALTPC